MDLTKWDPFQNFPFFRESDRFPSLFNDFFGSGPAMDVIEENDTIIVKAEIPGLTKDDISVDLDGKVLTISGKVEEETEDSSKKYYRKEIRSSSFCRSFELPSQIDPENVEAEFKDGILSVKLGKTEDSKTTKVEIK